MLTNYVTLVNSYSHRKPSDIMVNFKSRATKPKFVWIKQHFWGRRKDFCRTWTYDLQLSTLILYLLLSQEAHPMVHQLLSCIWKIWDINYPCLLDAYIVYNYCSYCSLLSLSSAISHYSTFMGSPTPNLHSKKSHKPACTVDQEQEIVAKDKCRIEGGARSW